SGPETTSTYSSSGNPSSPIGTSSSRYRYRYLKSRFAGTSQPMDTGNGQPGNGKSRRQQYCFRLNYFNEKFKKKYVVPHKKSREQSVMVWAAIYGDGKRSKLDFLNRDFKTKKMSYSATSYIKLLEDNITTIKQESMTFMQDNAPIHKARQSMAWL
ncbi:hypothetical protein KEM52_003764, partial [Ascosphaera acerosa]